jgi:transposase-like protein
LCYFNSRKRGKVPYTQLRSSRKWESHECVFVNLTVPNVLLEVLPDVIHDDDKWNNNRAEVSHQPTRQQERQRRRFKSPEQAQRFLSVHGSINNLFRLGRHRIKAAHYQLFRDRAFALWREVTCVKNAG